MPINILLTSWFSTYFKWILVLLTINSMKKQLLFNFSQSLFQKMSLRLAAFTVFTFLTVQSSFAQKWNVIASENEISSVPSCYTSIAVVGDVPYVAYVQATYGAGATGPGKVKMKNPSTGLWEQVGTDLSALAGFTRLYKDKIGDLFVTYIDRNTSYKLAVKKLVGGAWVPLSAGNDFVSTALGTGTFAASDIRGDLAFDKDNIPYVSYTERAAGNASGYAYVKRFVNNAWETVGGGAVSSDIFTAGNGIAFDSNNVPYVVYIQQAVSNSGSGVIKTYRLDSNNSWEDVSPVSPVAPGTTVSGATNVARHTSIAIDDTDSPVITYFNTTSGASKGTSIRLADKITKLWSWLGDISTRDTNRNMLINDSAGNLYTIFQDALMGGGTSATVRVFKKASGTSTFTELQNLPITSESLVGIDAAGPNSATAATKSITTATIALGSDTSKPYIVYNKTNSLGVVTPIVRLFDPLITSTAATAITDTGATLGGELLSSAPAVGTVTERGIVYDLTVNPTTASTKIADGATTAGIFTSPITGLTAATTYYSRAYFIYSDGVTTFTVYGDNKKFTTAAPLSTNSFEKSDFVKAYPNPTNDIVTVTLPDAAVIEKIAVYNSLGQLMFTEAKNSVSLQNLANGNYYLTIYTSDGNYAKKIIKK
jgi:hypothetical protein